MTHARSLVAAVFALVALGGCGVGGSSDEPVQLTVTRDFGAGALLDKELRGVPASETVMRLLQRNTDVTTRYGGTFAQCIAGLCGETGGKNVDWLYFVNGSEAPKGATATKVRGGDRVWWDRRDWSAAQRIPAVVGSFPEPFVHGPGSPKRMPVRVECVDLESEACKAVADALVAFDVPAAKGTLRRSITSETLRVLVGTWAALRDDNALALLESGPQASGVFAEPRADGRSIALLGPRGSATRDLAAGGGLIAATAAGEDPPVWAVTATGEAGVLAAARAFGVKALRNNFAVAVEGTTVSGLPLREVRSP